MDRFRSQLQSRLEACGIRVRDADRFKSVEASSAMLIAIQASEADAIIESLATASIATSETAMGQVLKAARPMADALQNAEWLLFDKIDGLGDPYKQQAGAIVNLVNNALKHDEHVTPLAATLRQAQLEAISLLAEAATKPPSPSELPPKPPAPGRKLAKQGQKTVRAESRRKNYLRRLSPTCPEQTGTTLEVDWKVYREE